MSNLLSQASLVMIPSGYKEDVVYSPVPTDGSGDLSFTRASNGTRVNSAGLVEVVPWNLVQQSEQIDNAAWVKFNCSITPNDAIAPNGTQTADKVVFSGSGHYFYQQTSYIGQATASIYVKGTAGETISIDNTQAITEPLITLTGEWQRITTTTTTSGSSVQGIALSTFQSATARTIYVWGGQVNAGTLKPYFPTTDRLNVPRLTYQNGGGGCPSLLLEKQSTNELSYSEQFDNAGWTKADVTVTANAITSPDGTQNADKIVENTANSAHGIYQSATITSGASWTWSGFFKAGGRTRFRLYAQSALTPYVEFNLSNGTIISTIGSVTGSIESMGNDWYRCIATTTTTGTNGYFNIAIADASGNVSYTGDGTSGIFIWGAQVEASSYATSYIPTTSSSATRVADECRKSSISSLIGQTEGVLFADVNLTTRQSFTYISISNGGSSANYIGIYFRAAAIEMEVVNGGVLQGNVQYSNTSTGRFKIAIGYKQNDFVLYVNGTQIGTDTSGTIPTCDRLDLFAFNDNQPLQVNETILFPTRLTNAELASLTTL